MGNHYVYIWEFEVAPEYAELDRSCAAYTSQEASLGSYWECDGGEPS